MTTAELQECLLRGFGYRKTTELRGEYIAPIGGPVVNTLHTVEVWVRDRSELPSNPVNDDLDDENAQREADEWEELSANW